MCTWLIIIGYFENENTSVYTSKSNYFFNRQKVSKRNVYSTTERRCRHGKLTESYEKTITDQLQITVIEKIVIVIRCTTIGFYTSPVKRIEQLPISTLSSRPDQDKNDNRSKRVIGQAVFHGKGNLSGE